MSLSSGISFPLLKISASSIKILKMYKLEIWDGQGQIMGYGNI